jgi:hypothetical protein
MDKTGLADCGSYGLPEPVIFLSHSKFMQGRFISHLAWACLALSTASTSLPQSKPANDPPVTIGAQETLVYNIQWRLIDAGDARLIQEPKRSKLHVESSGLVSKLYKLDDNYDLEMQGDFCATSTILDALERSRHRETKVIYDYSKGKTNYVEKDLLKNSVMKTAEVEIPPCTHDIIGALYKLRTLKLEPGQSTQIEVSDGKKAASARIEAQQNEQIKTPAGTFNTIRYEAFVFSGVLYARKAQLLIWISDDPRRLPVQIRVRLSFPIGTINLELQKEEHS